MSTTRTSSTHLTRRGRVLLLAALVGLLFAAFSMGRSTTQMATADQPLVTQQVVVQPGDTLWDLAQQVAPQGDPRAVVAQIRGLNGLQGSLQAGQVLLLPA